jgi:hypothetical protein
MYNAKPTRKEELAKGFTNKEIDRWMAPDGKNSITIVLHDGSWEVRVVGDDGIEVVGDQGTYTATKKLWIATSRGGPGGTVICTYRWSFDGKVLSLKLTNDSAGPKDFHVVRLVTEHDYVKVG